jgi:hypothetical protein
VGSAGEISAAQVASDWIGDFTASLGSLRTTGGGSASTAPGNAAVTLNGDFAGQLATPSLGDLNIRGNLVNARLMIGADLGADGRLGGAGANADHFSIGSLGSVGVGGSVLGTKVWVGVDPLDGTFDDGSDIILGGTSSNIQSIRIGGSLDATSKFEAGAFPRLVQVGGQQFAPLSDPHFLNHTVDVFLPTLTAALANNTAPSMTSMSCASPRTARYAAATSARSSSRPARRSGKGWPRELRRSPRAGSRC